MKLRDYQETAVADIDAAFKGNKRVLFVLPTGGGKTTIFSQVAADAVARGESVMVLAHRRELVDQADARLRRFGLSTGLVISGEEMTEDAPVQVASIQTLVRRFGKVKRPDLIIVDEAHRAVADSYGRGLAEQGRARSGREGGRPAETQGRRVGGREEGPEGEAYKRGTRVQEP